VLCAGQVYRTTIVVGDNSAPPGSASLVITKPDGTFVPGVVAVNSPAGSGTMIYDYTLPSAGLFKFAWTTTGPGTAPPPEFINVRDYRSIVSMAEVRAHLNKVSTATDDELSAFLMVATELVENKVGTCVPTTFTERIEEGRYRLVLAHHPVITVASVTSVWPNGPVWPTAQLRWDADAGIVDQVSPFPFYWPPWDVAYTCGRQVIAERWVHAAKEQIRHLWETQRGSQPPALLQGEEVFTASSGWSFSVPRRVLELLEQDMVPSI
jgi:hypothetical protein